MPFVTCELQHVTSAYMNKLQQVAKAHMYTDTMKWRKDPKIDRIARRCTKSLQYNGHNASEAEDFRKTESTREYACKSCSYVHLHPRSNDNDISEHHIITLLPTTVL